MEIAANAETLAQRVGDLLENGIPFALAYLSALATFGASWIYCMSEYGFLLGFGLGWLPSAILAGLVAFAVRWL
ncbi:MAG: hypothetical protein ACTHLU_00495 [Novosphingobium sp.]